MAHDDILTDDYVASLLAEEAKDCSLKYSAMGMEAGVEAFLRDKKPANMPRPNTRFLRHIIKDTDTHNKALLAKEAAESKARLEDLERSKEERLSKRNPDARDIRRRQMGDILAILGGGKRSRDVSRDRDGGLAPRRRDGIEGHPYDEDVSKREGESKHDREATHHRRERGGRHDGERRSSPAGGDARRSRLYGRHHDSAGKEEDSRRGGPRREGSRWDTTASSWRQRRSRSPKEEKRSGHRRRSRSPKEEKRSGHRQRSRSPREEKKSDHGQGSRHRHPRHRHPPEARPVSRRQSGGGDKHRPNEDDDSDPLDDLVGPAPPPKFRGRGTIGGAASLDRRFSDSYDPKTDVEMDDAEAVDWDDAVEVFRDRQKLRLNQAQRLRDAGFTDEQIRNTQDGPERTQREVVWSKAGEKRAWDQGKVGDTASYYPPNLFSEAG